MRQPDAWYRFTASRTGNLATLTALLSPVLIGLSAVAVDLGALHLERRQAQGLTDIAALTAVSDINDAERQAMATFVENGIVPALTADLASAGMSPSPTPDARIRVTTGRIDQTRPTGARFVPNALPADAVRVEHTLKGTLHFGSSLISPPAITVSAVAARTAEGMFSVGSRLASLDGGIANHVLDALLGGGISLSVMDYEALLDADISLFSFLDRLAIETGVTAGTYDDLLKAEGTLAQVARALSKIDFLPGSAKTALSKIAGSTDAAALDVPLNLLVDLGSAGFAAVGTTGGGIAAETGLLDILTAAAAVADGGRQLDLNLGAGIPGLLGLTLDLAVGEPPNKTPWLALGEAGTVTRTAQTRLYISFRLAGPGGAIESLIHLPIYVELASAEARLKAVSCHGGNADGAEMDIAARPGVAELRIASIAPGALDDFKTKPAFTPATLVDALVVKVQADARVALENVAEKTVKFAGNEIDGATVKTVRTTTPVTSLARSLIDDLDLQVKIVGIDLGLSALVSSTLRAVLKPLAPTLDEILMTLTDLLGVGIGEADIRAHGVRCGRPVLVQ